MQQNKELGRRNDPISVHLALAHFSEKCEAVSLNPNVNNEITPVRYWNKPVLRSDGQGTFERQGARGGAGVHRRVGVQRPERLRGRSPMAAPAPRMPASTTSAWSSSATACSALSSPNSCSRAFPEASEGELSLRLNAMVNAETLAEISEEIGLPDADQRRQRDARLAGRKRVNLRADALELLIAAIYLEGGIEAARSFITAPLVRAVDARVGEPRAATPRPSCRNGRIRSAAACRPILIDEPRRPRPRSALHRQRAARRLRAGAAAVGRTKRQAEQAAATAILHARGRLERTTARMSETAEQAAPATRSGFVALIGAPNAGKSTLVNRLVGTKVSIVTHKVQTTRAIVRGIATHDNAQIVLLDTPGIFKPRARARPRHGDDRLGRRQGRRHRAAC